MRPTLSAGAVCAAAFCFAASAHDKPHAESAKASKGAAAAK